VGDAVKQQHQQHQQQQRHQLRDVCSIMELQYAVVAAAAL
jgi:hypothetical protein